MMCFTKDAHSYCHFCGGVSGGNLTFLDKGCPKKWENERENRKFSGTVKAKRKMLVGDRRRLNRPLIKGPSRTDQTSWLFSMFTRALLCSIFVVMCIHIFYVFTLWWSKWIVYRSPYMSSSPSSSLLTTTETGLHWYMNDVACLSRWPKEDERGNFFRVCVCYTLKYQPLRVKAACTLRVKKEATEAKCNVMFVEREIAKETEWDRAR